VHPHRYRIFIGGGLSTAIREPFEGFTIISDGAYTTLIADLDQAALYGALLRIQALSLDLIELTRTFENAVRQATAGARLALWP
jgi:hypothetical protein